MLYAFLLSAEPCELAGGDGRDGVFRGLLEIRAKRAHINVACLPTHLGVLCASGDTEEMDADLASLFIDQSVKQLQQRAAHIETCLAKLTDDQVWSRGAAHENAIGNLILHLCGNVRQWIGKGVGGHQNIRDRDSEFSAGGGLSAAELVSRLNQTVEQACAILKDVTPERLAEEIDPQDGPVSVLGAIYHVVGHFQLHAGQIIFATKIYAGEDLGLYRPPQSKER